MEDVSFSDGKQSVGLRTLQSIQLEMLSEILTFCKIHEVPVFLAAGSALGACRHQGMIPWDDDIDLGMMRTDYKRFIGLWVARQDSDLYLQSSYTEKNYPHDSVKILKPGTEVFSEEFAETGFTDGIFIDIFPFDEEVKSPFLGALQKGILLLLNLILMSYSRNVIRLVRSPVGRMTRTMGFYIRKILPRRTLLSLREVMSEATFAKKTDKVLCYEMYGFVRHRKTIISRKVIFPAKFMPFANIVAPVPADNHAYLQGLFGDFMRLPDQAQQKPAHVRKVLINGVARANG